MHSKRNSIILRGSFLGALALAFSAALCIRFYSGWIRVEDLPAWPSYLAYGAASAIVWSLLEYRLPLAATLEEQAPLRGWAGRLLYLNLLTLAMVSAGAFFWRDYSFSRYVVGLFWIFYSAEGLVIGWVSRRLGVYRPRPARVWVATAKILDEDIRRYFDPVRREVAVRRFENPDAMSQALTRGAEPDSAEENFVALGSDQLAVFSDLFQQLETKRSAAGILLRRETSVRGKSESTLFLVPAREPAAEAFDYWVSKRIFDVALALAAIVVMGPVLLLVAVFIGLQLGRPVFFSQVRVGRKGTRFRLYKFRTLGRDALERGDHEWKVEPPNRLAAFLRTTGLDELPQLVNVLRGEMSLVGPRPERPHFADRFQSELPFYSTRHRLQVGITGWAQVNGLRGDTSIAERVEYDLYYLNHWSVWFDLRILARTVTGFFRDLGSFRHDGQST